MFLKYITLFSGLNYLIFAAVLLLKKSPIKRANNILGSLFVFLSIYSIILSIYFNAQQTNNELILKYYIPLDLFLLLSFGPCLYRYVIVLLGQVTPLNFKKAILQFIPFLPALVYIIYFLLQPVSVRLYMLKANFEIGLWQIKLLNILVYVQMITYLALSYFAIKKQFKSSTIVVYNNLQMDISWLKVYIVLNLGFLLLTLPLSFYVGNQKVNLTIAQLAMIAQFVYLFVKSTLQTGFFSAESVSRIKIKESSLKIHEQVADDYYKILIDYINKEKPYLNENCTIQYVSKNTNISIHHLSNILNNKVNKNFSDFINEFRINEAKQMLCSKIFEKKTVEAIGYDCGFGSKTSFNKVFKKYTNLTPSNYRNQAKL